MEGSVPIKAAFRSRSWSSLYGVSRVEKKGELIFTTRKTVMKKIHIEKQNNIDLGEKNQCLIINIDNNILSGRDKMSRGEKFIWMLMKSVRLRAWRVLQARVAQGKGDYLDNNDDSSENDQCSVQLDFISPWLLTWWVVFWCKLPRSTRQTKPFCWTERHHIFRYTRLLVLQDLSNEFICLLC